MSFGTVRKPSCTASGHSRCDGAVGRSTPSTPSEPSDSSYSPIICTKCVSLYKHFSQSQFLFNTTKRFVITFGRSCQKPDFLIISVTFIVSIQTPVVSSFPGSNGVQDSDIVSLISVSFVFTNNISIIYSYGESD